MTRILILAFAVFPSIALSDWAVAPDLESRVLWQLVAEGRAEVVSSVGFGEPNESHTKQTVFKILSVSESKGPIKWAVSGKGKFRPVMCTEVWEGLYKYRGSSCSIPGCVPDNEECLNEVTKNL